LPMNKTLTHPHSGRIVTTVSLVINLHLQQGNPGMLTTVSLPNNLLLKQGNPGKTEGRYPQPAFPTSCLTIIQMIHLFVCGNHSFLFVFLCSCHPAAVFLIRLLLLLLCFLILEFDGVCVMRMLCCSLQCVQQVNLCVPPCN